MEHLPLFGGPMIFGLLVGFGLLFVIYKQLYEKNIEAVEVALKDLEELK